MWTSVQTLDKQVLRLSEGGGANAVSGYGCVLVGDNRQLITVSAQQGAPGVDFYVGEHVTYDVDNW